MQGWSRDWHIWKSQSTTQKTADPRPLINAQSRHVRGTRYKRAFSYWTSARHLCTARELFAFAVRNYRSVEALTARFTLYKRTAVPVSSSILPGPPTHEFRALLHECRPLFRRIGDALITSQEHSLDSTKFLLSELLGHSDWKIRSLTMVRYF